MPQTDRHSKWEQALGAVFKALWGTDAHMETMEERQKAIEAIERMGLEAAKVTEVVRKEPKPAETIDEALKAISKDLKA